MSNICGKCKAKVLASCLKTLCNQCGFCYHATCAALNETDIDYMNEHNLSWTCPICRSNTRRLRSANDSAGGKHQESERALNAPTSVLPGADSQEGLSEFQMIMHKLTSIIKELADIKTSQANIETQISACNSRLEKHESLLQDQAGQIKNCRDDIESLRRHHNGLEASLGNLNVKVNEVHNEVSAASEKAAESVLELDDTCAEIVERMNRSRNLLIGEISGELDIKQAVSEILSTLGVDGSTYEVVSVVRLPSKNSAMPGLVKVTFNTPSVVVQFLKHKKKLSGTPYEKCFLFADKTVKQRDHLKRLRSEISRLQSEGNLAARIGYVNGVPKIVMKKSSARNSLNTRNPTGQN